MDQRVPYKRPQRLRRFVFTLNNWTQEEYNHLVSPAVTAKVRWMIVAKETGAECGTPHLQGAVVLLTQMAFSTVKTLLGSPRFRLENMNGTPDQSLVYCTKQDPHPFTYGQMPAQGKRNDLKDVCQLVLNGTTMRDLAANQDIGAVAIVKYHKGLTILRSLTVPPRSEPPAVYWIWGETGTGKTRSCFEFAEHMGEVWISGGGFKWFDGYDGQRSVLFDDFRSKGVSFNFLLRLIDRYPMRVEFKGGFVEWTPQFIFFTAPKHPDSMFASRLEHQPEDIRQLHRRISGIFELPREGKEWAFEQARILEMQGTVPTDVVEPILLADTVPFAWEDDSMSFDADDYLKDI